MSLAGNGSVYASIAANLAATAVYLFVGYQLYRRQVSPQARLASVQFSVWWAGLGADAGITGLQGVFYVGHALTFPLALTFEMIDLVVVSVLLWGLVGFLVYVYSGKYHLGWLTVYFASFYVVATYYILSEMPYAVGTQAGLPMLEYAGTGNLALALYVVLGILGPELVGAILYLTLLRRAHDATRRFRIALIGSSILLWFGLDLFIPSNTTEEVLVRSLLQFIPPLMALLAYFPPARLRARLGLASIDNGVETARGVTAQP